MRKIKKYYQIIAFNALFLGILAFVGIKLVEKTSQILDILYIQQGQLNKYYNDFYIAHHLKPSDDIFFEKLQQKDAKLYQLFKEGKLCLEKNQNGGKDFVYKTSKDHKKIPLSELLQQSFFKILFFNQNILIEFNEMIVSYEENTIYQYKNHSFVKTLPFDRHKIRIKYAEKINCPAYKIFAEDTFKQSAYVLIQSGEVNLIHSNFNANSEAIITELFQEIYQKEKDTFFINLYFYNKEDAICLK